ncbi:ekc keops complex subunit gon7 [Pyrenophora tritici-repentis]|nr:ekc keops complex subunit gon7 [Pyrenophora tritici-repentis]KAI0627094.1 ekc keops complex subunit gon7 [Pyrenophora tritici-repentis]KAI1526670.1 ekc keops complex subunit gon7 protein [Pyrenophora tritici-repentis]KAI1601181.1 ekc keops complex subunit gon7 protein [Pyrenophora tritici-repentis]
MWLFTASLRKLCGDCADAAVGRRGDGGVSNPRQSSLHHHLPQINPIYAAMPFLTATYTSPTSSSRTFTAELPALSSPPPTADRVAYLAELSSSLKNMQKDVNEFLTQKMADDKAADDAKDEETYGEEVVDQD